MIKIKKGYNAVLIFTLVGVFLWSDIAYSISHSKNSLRPQMAFGKKSLSTEAVFKEIWGDSLLVDELLTTTGRMVDELGISADDDVLCVGPGNFWSYIIALALRGAKVDIVQPEWDSYFFNQDLGNEIEYNARRIKLRYGIDILDKIDNSSYQTLLQRANVPKGHYSYAFVLHVLDIIIDEKAKEEFITKLLSALRNESYILISVWGGWDNIEKEIKTLREYGHGYSFKVVNSFNAVNTIVYQLKVIRNTEIEIPHQSPASQAL